MKLKDNKGINMITLSIAVILMIIITSVLVYNAKDGTKVKSLNNLYNDIEQLNNKVGSYYLEHGDIPKGVEYTNTGFIDNLENTDPQKNPNNAGSYYVINLSALEGVSLNYGRDYSQSSSAENVNTLEDLYIINEVSHTIYYPRGIRIENKTYYTEPNNWTNVDLSVIPIYTAEQMSWVGDGQQHEVNGVNYTFSLDGTYLLKNDIDLSSVCHKVDGTPANDVSWIPIGSQSTPFVGSFYGNGHEIQNIYINNTTNNGIVGLFKIAGGNCKIIDLGVSGIITSEVSVDAGGIVGVVYSNNSCSFINCYSKMDITSNASSYCVGGILSASDGTVIFTNCYNNGNISGSGQGGGILGYANGNVTINNCYNNGKIINDKGNCCGGLVGVNTANGSLSILNSYNKGYIIGKGYEGGILGTNNGSMEINYCYNDGIVKGETIPSGIIVGGIVGNNNDGIIRKCFNTSEIIGISTDSTSAIGGIAGKSSQQIIECYNLGEIRSESSYRTLIGGILGSGNNESCEIKNCYNSGNIRVINPLSNTASYTQYLGGIAGDNYNDSTIRYCYNTGNFYYNATESVFRVGGISGLNQNTSKVYNSYCLETTCDIISGSSAAQNIIDSSTKILDEMKEQVFVDLLNASQTDTSWQLDTGINNGFPILKWQTEQ